MGDLGSNLIEGFQTTIIGMGIVFFVLIVLSLVVSLFKYLNNYDKTKAITTFDNDVDTVSSETPNFLDDLELVAVISAAIANTLNTEISNINIRSIRKHDSKWKLQTKVEQQK